MRSFFQNLGRTILGLFTNKYLFAGLSLLIFLAAGTYILFDRAIMPGYTRHNVTVLVPSLDSLSFEEARSRLEQIDLEAHPDSHRYNPGLPRDIVLDQYPAANSRVKPGRRVYLTINTGTIPDVTVPSVEGIAIGNARSQIMIAGLKVLDSDVRPDSIPHPHENTVTGQFPEAGTRVPEGSRVMLWYSTGLGRSFVEVPDLNGLSPEEAQQQLLAVKLRSVVIMQEEEEASENLTVYNQSPQPGASIREGSELRLFVREEESS